MYSNILIAVLLCTLCVAPQRTLAQGIFGTSGIYPDTPHDNIISTVYGGHQASGGITYPYMAALSSGHRHKTLFCGGSIIGPKTILTAAHCIDFVFFDGSLDSSLRVTVGTLHRKNGGTMYTVSHNVTHPNYLPGPKKDDIGILITTISITFDWHISLIRLDYNFYNGSFRVDIVGWGLTEKGHFADNLMELTVTTLTDEQCLARMSELSSKSNLGVLVDPAIEICTYHSPGYGTCIVDSGGPLVVRDTGRQVGIVSWGYPCARGVPDVFVRISAFKDWLQSNIV